MATAAQFTANRANAQQSTGPKSPEGISTSSHNATKHGLAGKQVVIKGEDPAQYDALRASLLAEYAPATEREAMLVEEIAQSWWRLQRAKRAEVHVLNLYGLASCMCEGDGRRAFQTVTRYLNGLERTWRKACTELEQLQKARTAPDPPPPANAAIGFVSQKVASFPPPPPSDILKSRDVGDEHEDPGIRR